jgi:hypothetical protein
MFLLSTSEDNCYRYSKPSSKCCSNFHKRCSSSSKCCSKSHAVCFLIFDSPVTNIEASSDRNNFARVLNSSVSRSDTRLEVLHNVNNQPIQISLRQVMTSEHLIVSTLAGKLFNLNTMKGQDINALLDQLGLPGDGNVADCKTSSSQ